MGKLVDLIGGGVGLIAEASSGRSGRGSGQGRNGRASFQQQQQPQRQYSSRSAGSYNNQYGDTPPSYDQANRGFANRSYEEEDKYDYGEKSNSREISFRDQDRGLSDDYYNPNSSMQQNDEYNQQQIRNEDYARWQRQNFPSNPTLPPPTNSNPFHSPQTSSPRPFQDNTATQSQQLPILIPQRRPENKSRGWMLAYPPSLQQRGIGQESFIKFLLDFNKACQASPALDAVNLAAFGVGFAPGIAPMVVSMVVPVAVTMTKTRMVDTQAASFLENANRDTFGPRGLTAMITTMSGKQGQTVHYDTRNSNGMDDQVSAGQFTMPRSEELIYLDDGDVSPGSERSGLSKTGHFIGDYYDRRSQHQYAQNNPQYQDPNRPQPQFANRFSNPANGGSLIGVLSGGAIQRPSRSDRKSDRRDRRDRRRGKSPSSDYDDGGRQKRVGLIGSLKGAIGGPEAQGRGGLISMATSKIGGTQNGNNGNGGQSQGLIKGLKSKIAQEDLLYLMIVATPERSGSRGLSGSFSDVAELDGAQVSRRSYGDLAELESVSVPQRSRSSGGFRSETYGEDDTRRH